MPSPQDHAAPTTPYFTPLPDPAPGTSMVANPPVLFQPLTIRGVTFKNRIWAAPMCQYSASAFDEGPNRITGALTPYHLVHLGHLALKGVGLTFIEATAVTPNGRISPNDSGLWRDEQIEGIRRVAEFVHAQGGALGIQLAHAGRKASTVAPWLGRERGKSVVAGEDVGGWPKDVVGPSAIQWAKEGYYLPREMSEKEIEDTVTAFAESARRAVEAGVDVIEVHGAHGYLLNEFLSPLTNRRTDRYGGSFENRTRFPLDVLRAVRAAIPSTVPLMFRISSTEWMDDTPEGREHGSWDVPSTIALARLLPELGVDLLDVSSGGNHEAQRIQPHSNYQVDIAGQIRSVMKKEGIPLLIGAVGMITEAEQARSILERPVGGSDSAEVQETIEAEIERERSVEEEAGMVKESLGGAAGDRQAEAKADAVLLARQFMREPEWVLKAAWALDVKVAWPVQFGRARFAPVAKKNGSKI